MSNTTASLFSCLSSSPPIAFYRPAALATPIPLSHYCNVNKIWAGNVAAWWKSAQSMGSLHEKNGSTAQLSVSIIMRPIYREKELIVSLLVPCYPHCNPAEWSLAKRTNHWIKTIKLQRARLQFHHFDEGTIIQPIAILMSSSGLNILGETLLSCIKLSQKGEVHLIAWNSWSHTKYLFPRAFACSCPSSFPAVKPNFPVFTEKISRFTRSKACISSAFVYISLHHDK